VWQVLELLVREIERYRRLADDFTIRGDPTQLAMLQRAAALEARVVVLEERWAQREAVLEEAAQLVESTDPECVDPAVIAAAIRSLKRVGPGHNGPPDSVSTRMSEA
jgi:hypothetical protein